MPVYFGSSPSPLFLSYDRSTKSTPFPRTAAGYLYYRAPPAGYPFAGSLRLRINSDAARGSDLLRPNGVPWQIVLPQLVINEQYTSVLVQLLAEELVSPATVKACRKLFGDRKILTPNTLLFHLAQPFALRMTQAELRLTTVGTRKIGQFVKQNLFGERSPRMRYPFTGSIVVRFELSADHKRMHMRVLKVVEPVVCQSADAGYREHGRVVEPKEGELLAYRSQRWTGPQPWTLFMRPAHVRTPAADALHLLIKR
ncbi:hypothetical protein DFH08DRAFT_971122 [Mycena albidolilacea]|uniref:Uncharacterized protein n=1 Tax=Mycena albidolilacea TaxID=1033008 RepID=A0AAD7EGC4_9AGAR|nr:hypothetical protein DFH08DRAFT_971122 [Mycena albidolilacea]